MALSVGEAVYCPPLVWLFKVKNARFSRMGCDIFYVFVPVSPVRLSDSTREAPTNAFCGCYLPNCLYFNH